MSRNGTTLVRGETSSGAESIAAPLDKATYHPAHIAQNAGRFRESCRIVRHREAKHIGVLFARSDDPGYPSRDERIAHLAPIYPEWLGDRSFTETHGVRFPYVCGEMAQGIATARMVAAMAEAHMLGFFGAAGLPVDRIAQGLDEIAARCQNQPHAVWGANLIHSPQTPAEEGATVDLYIRRGVRNVSASAFLQLTENIVRYAVSGIRLDPQGRVVRDHHVFAKISRAETATVFLSPPPAEMLESLVRQGAVTAEQARLAARLSVAEDITVEADSGGHTGNRALTVILPTICSLRDRIAAQHGYTRPIRVGAAGGLGNPASIAAAFAMGAAYVLTGSINQSAAESGLSDAGRRLLALSDMTDVAMAPAADMFEMGVKVQVLKRGTLFAPRAQWLAELYRTYEGLDMISAPVRERLEREIFRASCAEIEARTLTFWEARNPREAERAKNDPKHRMALMFRWSAAHWAREGVTDRQTDFQIWCGPAMGAFNAWVRGSFLEPVENRTVVQIARNLMEGAAQITRVQQWRTFGVPVPPAAFHFRPRPLA